MELRLNLQGEANKENGENRKALEKWRIQKKIECQIERSLKAGILKAIGREEDLR